MDKPHKQLVTTYPVAIKNAQSRLHIPNPIPWHAHAEYVKCPKCEIIFIVTSGYPRVDLLKALEKQHEAPTTQTTLLPLLSGRARRSVIVRGS